MSWLSDLRTAVRSLMKQKSFSAVAIGTLALGIGVSVLPGVEIGAAAIVGAGAVVTEGVPAHTTVVGAPAKPLTR